MTEKTRQVLLRSIGWGKPRPPGRPPLPDGAAAESHLHIRVTRRRKAAYVRAANRTREKLSAWVLRHLDAAAQS